MSDHEALHEAMHAPEPEDDDETEAPGLSDDEAAEAEGAEEAPTDPAVEQAEQPEAQAQSPMDDPVRRKKVETSFNTYVSSLQRNYEEAAQPLLRCPLCPDNYPGFIHPADAGRYPPQLVDVIKEFLGLARPIDLKQSKRYHRCAECDGLGKVATDSRVPGNEDIKCEDCNGWGFVPPPGLPTNGNAAPDVLPTLQTASSPDVSNPDPDGFGQPRILPDGRENPNWMRLPSAWVDVSPWGKTAGLTAQDAVTT